MLRFLLPVFCVLFVLHGSVHAQNDDLVGPTTQQEVRQQHRIFDIYSNRYDPDSAAVAYLASVQDTVTIHVLFGTWCHDSKREIPALFKTLELADNPHLILNMTAVSRTKTDPTNAYERWQLEYTPTLVITRNGKEIGRIVEESSHSIEHDLADILQKGHKSSKR